MKLLVGCIYKTRGFTLVELILVMGIIALLVAVSLSFSISFYKTRQLDIHLNGIVQALRRAQLKSMSVEDDSSFGVYLTSDHYVLFKGGFYNTRDNVYDEIFELPGSLSVSGLSEIVFSRLKGIPSDTGIITLTINNQSETIDINEKGRVNY